MLFDNSLQFATYSDVAQDINFDSIKPTIKDVEKFILKSLIGTELYNWINDAYTANPAALTDDQKSLLEKCRETVAPYTTYYYAPKSDIILSEAGMQRTETQTHKTAYGYQGKNFREALLAEAENAAEDLLEFLSDNAEAYQKWNDSPEGKSRNNLFIKTGREFKQLYSATPQPYKVLNAIRFKMVDVELLTIKPKITPPLFAALKKKDAEKSTEWSLEETELMFMLKKAIAYLSIGAAVPHINANLDDNGITIISEQSLGTYDKQLRAAADPVRVSHLQRSCNDAGAQWLGEALNYIASNPTKFSDWTAPAAAAEPESMNANLAGVFGL